MGRCCLNIFVDSATPWIAACQAPLPLSISRNLPKFMFISSMMLSSHLIFWHPLLLSSIFPSSSGFSNSSSVCISWPKYWCFSFNISLSSEYSGLISLKIDWFDLDVQGTFRSLLQHYSSEASILGILPSLWSSSHNCTWPLVKGYKPSIIRWVSSGDLLYSLMVIANNIVLRMWKLLRE